MKKQKNWLKTKVQIAVHKQEEVQKQKKLVSEAAAKVETLRRDMKIDELPGASAQVQSTTLSDMEIQRKETALSELRSDMISRKVRLEKVADLTIEQLESTLPALQLEDSTTASTKQQYLQALQSVASMQKQGYGKKHPEMQAAIRAVAERRDQLNKLVTGIRRALSIDLSVAQARVESLEKEVSELRTQLRADRSDRLAPYNEARRDFETQSQLRRGDRGKNDALRSLDLLELAARVLGIGPRSGQRRGRATGQADQQEDQRNGDDGDPATTHDGPPVIGCSRCGPAPRPGTSSCT